MCRMKVARSDNLNLNKKNGLKTLYGGVFVAFWSKIIAHTSFIFLSFILLFFFCSVKFFFSIIILFSQAIKQRIESERISLKRMMIYNGQYLKVIFYLWLLLGFFFCFDFDFSLSLNIVLSSGKFLILERDCLNSLDDSYDSLAIREIRHLIYSLYIWNI